MDCRIMPNQEVFLCIKVEGDKIHIQRNINALMKLSENMQCNASRHTKFSSILINCMA